jgi:hypothetical protein
MLEELMMLFAGGRTGRHPAKNQAVRFQAGRLVTY